MRFDVKALLHNKYALAGLAAAAGLGGYVLYSRRKGGSSSTGTSDTTTTAAGTNGTPTLDTTGTDIASWLGQYSGSLQNQLDEYQRNLTDALAGLKNMPTTGGAGGTGGGSGSPVVGIPTGEKIGQFVKVVPFTSRNPPWASTLSGIAAHEGTTVERLLQLNPSITNRDVIRTGSQVRVR